LAVKVVKHARFIVAVVSGTVRFRVCHLSPRVALSEVYLLLSKVAQVHWNTITHDELSFKLYGEQILAKAGCFVGVS